MMTLVDSRPRLLILPPTASSAASPEPPKPVADSLRAFFDVEELPLKLRVWRRLMPSTRKKR